MLIFLHNLGNWLIRREDFAHRKFSLFSDILPSLDISSTAINYYIQLNKLLFNSPYLSHECFSTDE